MTKAQKADSSRDALIAATLMMNIYPQDVHHLVAIGKENEAFATATENKSSNAHTLFYDSCQNELLLSVTVVCVSSQQP